MVSSILDAGATLPAGANLKDSVLGRDEVLTA